MNPEKQRIKIAEACGWKRPDHPDVMKLKQGWSMPEKWWMCPKGVLRFKHDMPNYLSDLNAMHEAEKSLPDGHIYWEFIRILDELVKEQCLPYIADRSSATASQRAEAFLKTLNLWEDEA